MYFTVVFFHLRLLLYWYILNTKYNQTLNYDILLWIYHILLLFKCCFALFFTFNFVCGLHTNMKLVHNKCFLLLKSV